MRQSIMLSAALAVAVLSTGCAKKAEILEKKVLTAMSSKGEYTEGMKTENDRGEAYAKYVEKIKSPAESALSKKITADFYDYPVFLAMREISVLAGIPLDESFKPARTYSITATYKDVPLRVVLYDVYNKTGVKYAIDGGYLKPVNKEFLSEGYYENVECSKNGRISIDLKNVNVMDVLDYFKNRFGFGFTYDLRFGKLKHGGVYVKAKDFTYNGCDPETALMEFLKDNGYKGVKRGSRLYEIRDWERWEADVGSFYDYKFTSVSGFGGDTKTDSGVSFSMDENLYKEYEAFLKKIFGNAGSKKYDYSVSKRGFVTAFGPISKVEAVKKFFLEDALRQRPIKLNVTVYRISSESGDETGIELTEFIRKSLKGVITAGNSGDGNALKIKLGDENRKILVGALEKYGDVSIVRKFKTTARGGFITSFKAVTQQPYLTASQIVNNGIATTTTKAEYAQAGLVINVLPTVERDRTSVYLSNNIVLSEYLGDKKFNMNNNEYVLPIISSNEVNVGTKIGFGESLILTGFRAKTDSVEGNGVPGIGSAGIFSVFMGDNKKSREYSNFVIVITPEEMDI